MSSNAEYCIHCNTKLDETVKTKKVISDYQTEGNIRELKMLAAMFSILLSVGGAILLMVSLVSGIAYLIITSIIAIICGFVLPATLKWMAMMLKNMYEINRKK